MRYLELSRLSNVRYLINNNKIYTTSVNNKTTMYSFMDLQSATNCKSFLTNYKKFYGNYPGKNAKEMEWNGTERTEWNEQLEVEEDTIGNLQNTCLLLNIGLLGITQFNYSFNNKQCNVELQAVDLITDDLEKFKETDDFRYIRYLFFWNNLKNINLN